MEEKNNNKKSLEGFVDKTKKLFGYRQKHDFTAEFAWLETTYGEGSYRSLEERIADKQKQIVNDIKSKFPYYHGEQHINSSCGYINVYQKSIKNYNII